VLFLTGTYAVCIERYIVLVNTYRVAVPKLPKAFEDFTIVHLTDLHCGFLVSRSFLRGVFQKVVAIPRDIIVCTGDFVHEKNGTGEIDTLWPEMSILTAPYGVYSVLGNHDYWASENRSLYWMQKTGFGLHHRAKQITKNGEHLWLVGAGDLWEDHRNLDILLDTIPEDDCRIVLAHNPDTADTDFTNRVDCMFAGHTHGGQVKIPFGNTPVLPVRNKSYSSGLVTTKKGFPMYISRGIGWAIYPVRFNCYPEISVVQLTCK